MNRLTISQWDISWLFMKNKIFSPWEVRLEEAKERGFNTIRIDPFVDFDSTVSINISKYPQYEKISEKKLIPWLKVQERKFEFDFLKELLNFLKLCKEKKLLVILSSSALDINGIREHFSPWTKEVSEKFIVHHPDLLEHYIQKWKNLLTEIKERGFIDTIAYVDIVNEADLSLLFFSGYSKLKRIPFPFGEEDPKKWYQFMNRVTWTFLMKKQRVFFKETCEGLIEDLKKLFPNIMFTVSMTIPLNFPLFNYRKYIPNNCDLLDFHFWVGVHPLFSLRKLPSWSLELPEEAELLLIQKSYRKIFKRYSWIILKWLFNAMKVCANIGRKRGIPVVITEGYGTPLPNFMDWELHKEISERCIDFAIEQGYQGVTTCNASSPIFPFWDEVEWHQRVNLMFNQGVKN